uniref:Uncharacterized protein n=1 Tax=Salix viminalis TaxID=40686 RepID=A0A6N2L2C9_SALVM
MDQEAGLDCLTGAIVSYPPITALWLANPAARISISGHRNEDDPLHFSTKVWKSRIRLLTRSPCELHLFPSEKWVLFASLTIHVIGFSRGQRVLDDV